MLYAYSYKYAIPNNFIHQVHFQSFISKQNADFCNHWLQEVKKDVFYSISILLDSSDVFGKLPQEVFAAL